MGTNRWGPETVESETTVQKPILRYERASSPEPGVFVKNSENVFMYFPDQLIDYWY